jgi:hypothetical protein
VRGETASARAITESSPNEAMKDGRAIVLGGARPAMGLTCLFRGELALACSCLEQVLVNYAPDRDGDERRIFGTDTRILTTAYLAFCRWLMGDVERAPPG